jgi:hypothetical protein
MSDSVSFYLPFGLEKDGKIYRAGHMHLATTGDELHIQAEEETGMNSRYRDILLLAAVIDDLDGFKPDRIDIEGMFEADFLYLQMLYRQLNGAEGSSIETQCPECHQTYAITLSNLYEDMSTYEKKEVR